MRREKGSNAGALAGVLACAFLILALLASPVRAQDVDHDGFEDGLEASPGGIVLADGSTVVLDPTVKDLFFILVRKDPTFLPADPLAFVSGEQAMGGLGIAIHEIAPEQAYPDRTVTSASPQKAIRITESSDEVGEVLGISNYGTPNGPDLATIYPLRVINHVQSVCAGASTCQDSSGLEGVALEEKYIRQTIAHETGHLLALTDTYNKRFGGYHYKTGSEVIMEQSVYYTSKGGKVTFYISDAYTGPDQQVFRMY